MNETIEVYNITPEAVDMYRKNAKRSKNLPTETLKRKLTGLAINASRKEIFHPMYKYTYGAFVIHINENTRTIENIYWSTEDNTSRWITTEERERLANTFIKLGLSKTGNCLITD